MTTRRDSTQIRGQAPPWASLFTPAPWRLITDTALWSENWPGIPRPARGEIRAKTTHCTLCPAGCAVRARCVGEQPVALAGAHGGLVPARRDGAPSAVPSGAGEAGAGERGGRRGGRAIAKCGPASGSRCSICGPAARRRGLTGGRWQRCANGVYLAPTAAAAAGEPGVPRKRC